MGDELCDGESRRHVFDRDRDAEAFFELGDEFENLERIEPEISDEIVVEPWLDRPSADALQRIDHAGLDVGRPGCRHDWGVRIACDNKKPGWEGIACNGRVWR